MHIQYFGTLTDEIENQEVEYYLQALVLKSVVVDCGMNKQCSLCEILQNINYQFLMTAQIIS